MMMMNLHKHDDQQKRDEKLIRNRELIFVGGKPIKQTCSVRSVQQQQHQQTKTLSFGIVSIHCRSREQYQNIINYI